MKLTKRLFTLLLALLMASACFVGCSGDDNHNDGDDDKNSTSAEIKDDDQNGKDEIIKDDTTANDTTAEDTTAAPDIILPHEHTYEKGACTVCGELKLSEGLKYTLNDDGESYSVSGRGYCRDSYIVIPATYEGKPVTDIASSAFQEERHIEGIIIPEGVTSIGAYAFYYCSKLKTISIPDTIRNIDEGSRIFMGTALECYQHNGATYLGNADNPYVVLCGIDGDITSFTIPDSTKIILAEAFFARSVKSITIPDGVVSIGWGAFRSAYSLTSITIPDSVTSIGGNAFYDCPSLKSVTIGSGVTSIGGSAFADCPSLTSITVDENNPVYHSAGNCIIETGTKTLAVGFGASVIPDDGSVTSIGVGAFSGCDSLKSITIPDSVTSIGEKAFVDCTSLKSINIPDSVTSIGDYAFTSCTSLTSINIPEGVTSIGVRTFAWCTSLTSITIPDSVTSISEGVFYLCSSLTSINYGGTKAQWNAVDKYIRWEAYEITWNSNTGNYTVHCTDGDIAK